MEVIYATRAKEDRTYWEQHNTKITEKIDRLIADIQIHPFTGLGKPEALKFEKAGYWSRRINQEHRLVYKVAEGRLYIAQCRYHYEK